MLATGLETSGCKRCPSGAKSYLRPHICKTSFCLTPATGAAGESHLQSRSQASPGQGSCSPVVFQSSKIWC